MFAQGEDPNCPVHVYKKYRSHRPADLNHPEARFYLRPISNPTSDIWFSHQPVGKEKLGRIMNTMAEKGGLTGRKVNHSSRKTFATSLVQAGLPPTEVAHLGGWKNIQTINEYSAPSVKQQEAASGIISNVLVPKDVNTISSVDTIDVNNVAEENHTDITFFEHKSVSATKTCNRVQTSDNPLSILSGATISGGNITINIIPSKKRKYEMTHCNAASSESSQEN